jgi:hypothetical protein
LLSVVVQTFSLIVFSYLFVGEDIPPSFDDTEEGYQWEIQPDEEWVHYWDSHVYVI